MTPVSRRQAVYLTGTGLTAATVTACAPKVQPAGNDASTKEIFLYCDKNILQ